MAAGCHEFNMSREEGAHRCCVRIIRSRRFNIMLMNPVMYLVIMSMVLWHCGMGITFVESHADDEIVNQRAAGSSIRILSATSGAGLCQSIIQVAGYPCDEIKVKTSDGFLLGMQHIAYGSKRATSAPDPRPPVFLQHGLIQVPNRIILLGTNFFTRILVDGMPTLCGKTGINNELSTGGDDWVLNSPDQSLAYMLADQGFDVWIGNIRCTRWSHGHISLSSSNRKYWDWSFDEHATIDMPALVNYVRNVTGSPVYYVGHSQGTIMALAALSVAETRMLDIVKAFVLLAPIAYLEHIQSPFLNVCADIMLDVWNRITLLQIVEWFGTREFTLYNEVGVKLLERACRDPNVDCESLIDAATGSNCCLNTSRVYYYLQWEPQSTSTKNLAHLAQMMRTGKFLKYDYGLAGNLANYKQLTPPPYALSNIPTSTRMLLISGGHDIFANSKDVARLVEEMPCHVETLNLPNYGHADFVVGTKANVDVYMPIIAYFQSLVQSTNP